MPITSSFPASFNLTDLNGINGFTINGVAARDQSGSSVAAAGDINGDGVGDVLVNAFLADPDGRTEAGQNYLIFGHRDGFISPFELTTLNSTNGVAINGINHYDWTHATAGAGDVNGDGIGDMIIGAHHASPNNKAQAGQSYLIFGHRGGFTSPFELSTLNGTNGIVINGIAANDQSGLSVSAAGDVNGDEIDDVIIGAVTANFIPPEEPRYRDVHIVQDALTLFKVGSLSRKIPAIEIFYAHKAACTQAMRLHEDHVQAYGKARRILNQYAKQFEILSQDRTREREESEAVNRLN